MADNNTTNDAIKTVPIPTEPTMHYVLSRMDQILNDKRYIEDAIRAIGQMQVNDSYHGGLGDQARFESIGRSIEAREKTNQMLLEMLEKMYEDLKA